MRTRRASRSTHTDGKACVPLSRRISKIVLRQSNGPLTYFLSTIHMWWRRLPTLTPGDHVQFSRAAQAW